MNLLNTTDQQEEPETTLDDPDLIHKIQALKDRKQKLEEDLNTLAQLGKKQYNKTDPDATLMCKPAHHQRITWSLITAKLWWMTKQS